MLVKQPFEQKGIHFHFSGTAALYHYVEDGNTIGTLHVWISDKQVGIDHMEVSEEFRGKGHGTKMVQLLFQEFPMIGTIIAYAEEDVLDQFWKKQDGFVYGGEMSDEMEGYFFFKIQRKGEWCGEES